MVRKAHHEDQINMRTGRILLTGAALVGVFVYLNNASWLAPEMSGKPVLLAHRGLAQTFSRDGLTNETCTASRIDPPRHAYLENTIASIEAAFQAGADIVEFDVHPTTDGHFAVFHDWTADCRTEGRGVTREHTLAELKALDIGYGYTADGGRTFPFRGKGVGLMPSLDEVLTAFPERRLLINVKSNDPEEGELLGERLAGFAPEQRRLLMAYGGDLPMVTLRTRVPDIAVMSRASLKGCAIGYLALGWSGYVPKACEHTLLLVPQNYAWFLWGWPKRFLDRMRTAGTAVFVTGPYGSGDPGTSGVDDEARLKALPERFDGGIWTNTIDLIGPIVRAAGG
jgi:glycerophosphoryl diester phosphodiesterase